MKLAILTPVWRGSLGGGIKVYAVNLADTLASMGHRVEVYARLTGSGTGAAELRVAQPVGSLFFVESIWDLLGREVDGIICHEGRNTFLVAAVYSFLKRIPVVYVIHTFRSRSNLSSFLRLLYRVPFAVQKTGRFRVVFVSEQLRRHVAETFKTPEALESSVVRASPPPPESVPRDPEAIRQFRARWGVADGDYLILGQGLTIATEKAEGAAVLIRAVARLRQTDPSVKLMLSRSGTPVHWLQDVARQEGVADAVIFTGELRDPLLAVHACDLFAHIVMNEGLPLSVLEAMAVGRPILAARRGGIPEVIEDGVNGLLIEPELDAVQSAIQTIRNDDLLRSRICAGAGKRAAEMSWRETAQRYLELLSGER